MKGRLDFLGRVAFSLAATLVLSSPPAAAQEDIWRTLFRGSAEVNVVNVEVMVTDADGLPVKGLRKDDFALFEDGERVVVSNFYAVEDGRTVLRSQAGTADVGTVEAEAVETPADEPAVPPVAQEPATLVLYIDNANLRASNRARIFERVRQFLLAQRHLDARVMVLSNDGPAGADSLIVRQGTTSVPHDVFVALDETQRSSSDNVLLANERRDLIRAIEAVNVEAGSGLFGAKDRASVLRTVTNNRNTVTAETPQSQVANRVEAETAAVLVQIRAYSAQRHQRTLATLRGLRRVVDLAAGLPGRKSVLYVSDGLPLRPGEAFYEGFSRRFSSLANIGPQFHPEAEASRDDATPQFRELVEHANGSRVTFYTLDASTSAPLERGSAATGGSGGNFGSWKDSVESTEESGSQDSIRSLAEETGGRFGLTHTTYGALFAGLAADFGNYYSLGFVAAPAEEGETRSIRATVRGEPRRLRYRRSYRDKPIAERAAERTRAALLLDNLANPFEISLATDDAEPQEDGTFLVKLKVQIPLGKLVLLPGKAEHQGQVSMFVAVRDDKGRTSDVNRHLCPIRIPNAEVLTALGQTAVCGVRLRMRGGPQRIAVSVLDELTAVDSTARLAIDVGSSSQRAELGSSR